MANVTTRDKVWALTLAHLAAHRSFRLGDLPIEESERVTAARVWSVMEYMGVLHRGDDEKTWYRGSTAQLLIQQESVEHVEWTEEDRMHLEATGW